jgi:DNA replication and repair protein RecF
MAGLPHYNVHEHVMILTELYLKNFRNHAETELRFGRGISALLGRNGQGKTNIIEAISYLGLTKSFYASTDAHVLKIGEEEFDVEGSVLSDTGIAHRVGVHYARGSGEKSVTVDSMHPGTMASVIGRFPVVILSPEHGAITSGGPGERRRFLDILLSQVNASYLSDLLEYRKMLRQRNRVLADLRTGGAGMDAALEPWTEVLADTGSRIISRRIQFVGEFRSYVSDAYRAFVSATEQPDLLYSGTRETDGSAADIRKWMLRALEDRHAEEHRRGQTLVGPHRDDLRLTIDGLGVQEFASQGQHKSFLVALKVAEFRYMCDRRGEAPMLLLDDVFSELDEYRAGSILRVVMDLGQSIITATEERVFHGSIPWNTHHRRFLVENGRCRAA